MHTFGTNSSEVLKVVCADVACSLHPFIDDPKKKAKDEVFENYSKLSYVLGEKLVTNCCILNLFLPLQILSMEISMLRMSVNRVECTARGLLTFLIWREQTTRLPKIASSTLTNIVTQPSKTIFLDWSLYSIAFIAVRWRGENGYVFLWWSLTSWTTNWSWKWKRRERWSRLVTRKVI